MFLKKGELHLNNVKRVFLKQRIVDRFLEKRSVRFLLVALIKGVSFSSAVWEQGFEGKSKDVSETMIPAMSKNPRRKRKEGLVKWKS